MSKLYILIFISAFTCGQCIAQHLHDSSNAVVYSLPCIPGRKISIAQGYNGIFSHKGSNALDFNMRKGQFICAARKGIVVNCKSDSKIGGASRKFINDGNYIIIMHEDSSYAAYWHLNYQGVMVKKSDTVETGDTIGVVGSTGFSSGPHLHFEAYYYDSNGAYQTLRTPFYTTRGIKVLKGWHFYRRPELD